MVDVPRVFTAPQVQDPGPAKRLDIDALKSQGREVDWAAYGSAALQDGHEVVYQGQIYRQADEGRFLAALEGLAPDAVVPEGQLQTAAGAPTWGGVGGWLFAGKRDTAPEESLRLRSQARAALNQDFKNRFIQAELATGKWKTEKDRKFLTTAIDILTTGTEEQRSMLFRATGQEDAAPEKVALVGEYNQAFQVFQVSASPMHDLSKLWQTAEDTRKARDLMGTAEGLDVAEYYMRYGGDTMGLLMVGGIRQTRADAMAMGMIAQGSAGMADMYDIRSFRAGLVGMAEDAARERKRWGSLSGIGGRAAAGAGITPEMAGAEFERKLKLANVPSLFVERVRRLADQFDVEFDEGAEGETQYAPLIRTLDKIVERNVEVESSLIPIDEMSARVAYANLAGGLVRYSQQMGGEVDIEKLAEGLEQLSRGEIPEDGGAHPITTLITVIGAPGRFVGGMLDTVTEKPNVVGFLFSDGSFFTDPIDAALYEEKLVEAGAVREQDPALLMANDVGRLRGDYVANNALWTLGKGGPRSPGEERRDVEYGRGVAIIDFSHARDRMEGSSLLDDVFVNGWNSLKDPDGTYVLDWFTNKFTTGLRPGKDDRATRWAANIAGFVLDVALDPINIVGFSAKGVRAGAVVEDFADIVATAGTRTLPDTLEYGVKGVARVADEAAEAATAPAIFNRRAPRRAYWYDEAGRRHRLNGRGVALRDALVKILAPIDGVPSGSALLSGGGGAEMLAQQTINLVMRNPANARDIAAALMKSETALDDLVLMLNKAGVTGLDDALGAAARSGGQAALRKEARKFIEQVYAPHAKALLEAAPVKMGIGPLDEITAAALQRELTHTRGLYLKGGLVPLLNDAHLQRLATVGETFLQMAMARGSDMHAVVGKMLEGAAQATGYVYGKARAAAERVGSVFSNSVVITETGQRVRLTHEIRDMHKFMYQRAQASATQTVDALVGKALTVKDEAGKLVPLSESDRVLLTHLAEGGLDLDSQVRYVLDQVNPALQRAGRPVYDETTLRAAAERLQPNLQEIHKIQGEMAGYLDRRGQFLHGSGPADDYMAHRYLNAQAREAGKGSTVEELFGVVDTGRPAAGSPRASTAQHARWGPRTVAEAIDLGWEPIEDAAMLFHARLQEFFETSIRQDFIEGVASRLGVPGIQGKQAATMLLEESLDGHLARLGRIDKLVEQERQYRNLVENHKRTRINLRANRDRKALYNLARKVGIKPGDMVDEGRMLDAMLESEDFLSLASSRSKNALDKILHPQTREALRRQAKRAKENLRQLRKHEKYIRRRGLEADMKAHLAVDEAGEVLRKKGEFTDMGEAVNAGRRRAKDAGDNAAHYASEARRATAELKESRDAMASILRKRRDISRNWDRVRRKMVRPYYEKHLQAFKVDVAKLRLQYREQLKSLRAAVKAGQMSAEEAKAEIVQFWRRKIYELDWFAVGGRPWKKKMAKQMADELEEVRAALDKEMETWAADAFAAKRKLDDLPKTVDKWMRQRAMSRAQFEFQTRADDFLRALRDDGGSFWHRIASGGPEVSRAVAGRHGFGDMGDWLYWQGQYVENANHVVLRRQLLEESTRGEKSAAAAARRGTKKAREAEEALRNLKKKKQARGSAVGASAKRKARTGRDAERSAERLVLATEEAKRLREELADLLSTPAVAEARRQLASKYHEMAARHRHLRLQEERLARVLERQGKTVDRARLRRELGAGTRGRQPRRLGKHSPEMVREIEHNFYRLGIEESDQRALLYEAFGTSNMREVAYADLKVFSERLEARARQWFDDVIDTNSGFRATPEEGRFILGEEQIREVLDKLDVGFVDAAIAKLGVSSASSAEDIARAAEMSGLDAATVKALVQAGSDTAVVRTGGGVTVSDAAAAIAKRGGSAAEDDLVVRFWRDSSSPYAERLRNTYVPVEQAMAIKALLNEQMLSSADAVRVSAMLGFLDRLYRYTNRSWKSMSTGSRPSMEFGRRNSLFDGIKGLLSIGLLSFHSPGAVAELRRLVESGTGVIMTATGPVRVEAFMAAMQRRGITTFAAHADVVGQARTAAATGDEKVKRRLLRRIFSPALESQRKGGVRLPYIKWREFLGLDELTHTGGRMPTLTEVLFPIGPQAAEALENHFRYFTAYMYLKSGMSADDAVDAMVRVWRDYSNLTVKELGALPYIPAAFYNFTKQNTIAQWARFMDAPWKQTIWPKFLRMLGSDMPEARQMRPEWQNDFNSVVDPEWAPNKTWFMTDEFTASVEWTGAAINSAGALAALLQGKTNLASQRWGLSVEQLGRQAPPIFQEMIAQGRPFQMPDMMARNLYDMFGDTRSWFFNVEKSKNGVIRGEFTGAGRFFAAISGAQIWAKTIYDPMSMSAEGHPGLAIGKWSGFGNHYDNRGLHQELLYGQFGETTKMIGEIASGAAYDKAARQLGRFGEAPDFVAIEMLMASTGSFIKMLDGLREDYRKRSGRAAPSGTTSNAGLPSEMFQ